MPPSPTSCGHIGVACGGQTPDQQPAWPRAPTREVTTALRHPEAALPDRGPPPAPPLDLHPPDWREFPFMAPGCQAGPAPTQLFWGFLYTSFTL